MKVLHISEWYAPVGGAETYMLALLRELERDGHENVVLYRQEHPRTLREANRRAFHVGAAGSQQVSRIAVDRVRQIIRDENPDSVYLHLTYDSAMIRLVADLRPTVAYVHNFHPLCPGLGKYFRRGGRICPRPFGWVGCAFNIYLRRCASARHPVSVWRILHRTALQREAFRRVRQIFVASRYMKSVLVQNRFVAERIQVLPCFVDLLSVVDPAVRESKGAVPTVLFAGRVEWEKGVPFLLEAMARLETPFRLVVAGDGMHLDACKALARSLGIAARTHFTGWLSRSELVDLYRGARLLVFPSIWPEPFGLSGPEAMACGTPVVAFAVGGVVEWLEDGVNGFLVPPQDVGQLAQKIDVLLHDEELARGMGDSGRWQVAEMYSVSRHVEGLMAALARIV